MIAQIITFQSLPGRTDDLLDIATTGVLPLLQQQAGCTLITLLTNYAADKVLTVGLWESEAQLLAIEQSAGYQEQLAKTTHIVAAPPLREVYAVSLQTAPI